MLHMEIENCDEQLLKMMYLIVKGYHNGEPTAVTEQRKRMLQTEIVQYPLKKMERITS